MTRHSSAFAVFFSASLLFLASVAPAQDPSSAVQSRVTQEAGRASAEAEAQVATALAAALERSDYARKRSQAGLVDIGDTEFAGFKMKRSAEEWRRLLSPEQFRVTQEKAAEPASEAFQLASENGIFQCPCGQPLFHSKDHQHGEGALAHFKAPIEPSAVVSDVASAWSHEHEKVELRCSMCGNHLGHVDPGEDAEDPMIFKVKPTALVIAETPAEK